MRHPAGPVPFADTRDLRRAILRPHQSPAELAAAEPDDPLALAAGVRGDDGALVAVGFVHPDPDAAPGDAAWRVRGMATAPEARGRGAGSAVLAVLLDHAAAHGAVRVWCNARTPALSLYERAGFTATSGVFDLPPMGPHVVMERTTPPPDTPPPRSPTPPRGGDR
ncbi:GNAT family N-acetyltransferase [Paraconexibacter antarcticus]|uniref:GNAT family N-acetyltransferase n=1 Tax=Paraconexibacter antarcticus TaxID=2949664 RepID=A0ABY5DXD5_9ACTN|nr:GNAT family N-acetyltransferase [Paraconexibacter antarcticus]UTI65497.1 GNAT family N-acetyltransferase [Paraconexibacter antarcticus]